MTRFYDIDEANATVAELDPIVTVLAEQRDELVRLRDHALARSAGASAPTEPLSDEELRLLRLRMQGLVDQMAAGVARIDQLGLTLRDIGSGLVDFPALVSGRQVWLCWRKGEATVDWWHDLDSGFSGRRPLSELA
ncbi:MAG TPA: DUF2203 domain-containing protein [Clostridia bacterium]|nr:DUF2203 domain-containing protein [Clostridia bacterium]